MTLTEFLLARIADVEAWAQEALDLSNFAHTREWRWVRFYGHPDHPKTPSSSAFYKGAPTPARVLAECEAKRRIVDEHWPYDDTGTCNVCTDIARGIPWPCPTLRFLALPYADHPDYREEWKP